MHSMTGFGKASAEFKNRMIQVEVKSLNSKNCDINLKSASRYKAEDLKIRSLIKEVLDRGKIEMYIKVESIDNEQSVMINQDLANKYYSSLKSMADQLGADTSDLFKMAIGMPEVISREKEEMEEEEIEVLFTVVKEAMADMMTFRLQEGEKLDKEIGGRVDNIVALLEDVKDIDEERVEGVRERIKSHLAKADDIKVDENRFEQELIFYIEKLDITEEKVRLRAHCDYFHETMKTKFSGKKLGFISQEIGREVNTLGSKSYHAGMQRIVVQMKDELEKIKEQVLNVL
jgi:uncharacterized protein (TIGR00255 family)